jgi:hypothetical protein
MGKGSSPGIGFSLFWEPFSITNPLKHPCKNQCQKNMEVHEKSMRK